MQSLRRSGKISRRALVITAMLCGVLYGVFKPVYDRAWHAINQPACQNHLKLIGLALQIYARDSDNYLPPVFSSPGKVGWAGAIQPYVGSAMSGWPYECPFDASKHSKSPASPGFTDYWYNANVMRKMARGPVPARVAQMKSPPQTVLAGCGGSATRGTGFDASYNLCGDGTSLDNSSQTCALALVGLATFPNQPVHYDLDFGSNLLFADGHVKWLAARSATASTAVQNNGATRKSIGGFVTFGLLDK